MFVPRYEPAWRVLKTTATRSRRSRHPHGRLLGFAPSRVQLLMSPTSFSFFSMSEPTRRSASLFLASDWSARAERRATPRPRRLRRPPGGGEDSPPFSRRRTRRARALLEFLLRARARRPETAGSNAPSGFHESDSGARASPPDDIEKSASRAETSSRRRAEAAGETVGIRFLPSPPPATSPATPDRAAWCPFRRPRPRKLPSRFRFAATALSARPRTCRRKPCTPPRPTRCRSPSPSRRRSAASPRRKDRGSRPAPLRARARVSPAVSPCEIVVRIDDGRLDRPERARWLRGRRMIAPRRKRSCATGSFRGSSITGDRRRRARTRPRASAPAPRRAPTYTLFRAVAVPRASSAPRGRATGRGVSRAETW